MLVNGHATLCTELTHEKFRTYPQPGEILLMPVIACHKDAGMQAGLFGHRSLSVLPHSHLAPRILNHSRVEFLLLPERYVRSLVL